MQNYSIDSNDSTKSRRLGNFFVKHKICKKLYEAFESSKSFESLEKKKQPSSDVRSEILES